MLKDITKTRLNFIISKAQLLLHADKPRNQYAYSAVVEISDEIQKVIREIVEDNDWRNGDEMECSRSTTATHNCSVCHGIGWVVWYDNKGDPEQRQCEVCYGIGIEQ